MGEQAGCLRPGRTVGLTAVPLPPLPCLPGVPAAVIYEPVLSRIYPYLMLICFAGIFVLISFRQLMIIKWKLPYPSGTASGHMVRSLHTEVRWPPVCGATAAASRQRELALWSSSSSALGVAQSPCRSTARGFRAPIAPPHH